MEENIAFTATRRRSDATAASSLRRCSLTEGTSIEMFDYDWLAEDLTEQPWHEVGSCLCRLDDATKLDTMVHQLAALLVERLRELLHYFALNDKNFISNHSNLLVANECNSNLVFLSEELTNNLHSYVARIASLYNDVPFHSFDHAAHVTMSMNKIISMMISEKDVSSIGDPSAASEYCDARRCSRRSTVQHVSHSKSVVCEKIIAEKATYGISSDPLLKFALLFSALIHDVAHKGVPNSTLIDEEDELAILHNDISVAEQTSLQTAFSVLREKEFALLKEAIMPNAQVRKIFRKYVIQLVLVTDISNPERMQICRSRWAEAFENTATSDAETERMKQKSAETKTTADSAETKTTADSAVTERRRETSANTGRRHTLYESVKSKRIIETKRLGIRFSVLLSGQIFEAYANNDIGQQLLQRDAVTDLVMNVADVAHTMQKFPTFLRWNQQLYIELFNAYHAGRIPNDPTEGWYQNQINFFDNYIIPLATRMDRCRICGSKSPLFLYFAMENKRKWSEEGQAITADMVESVGKACLVIEYQKFSDNELQENDDAGDKEDNCCPE